MSNILTTGVQYILFLYYLLNMKRKRRTYKSKDLETIIYGNTKHIYKKPFLVDCDWFMKFIVRFGVILDRFLKYL